MKRAAWAWVVLAGAMLAPGCCRPPEHRVSLETLVAAHNANADAVPKVWARAKIAVTMQDPASGVPFTWGSTSPLVTPNGLLVMVKGADRLGVQDFVLIGQEANIDLFRLGASTEENKYYFWLRAGARGRAWWGRPRMDRARIARGLSPRRTRRARVLPQSCRRPRLPTWASARRILPPSARGRSS